MFFFHLIWRWQRDNHVKVFCVCAKYCFVIDFRWQLLIFGWCLLLLFQHTDFSLSLAPILINQGKLSEAERKELLEPLLAKGWTLVNGRDAIYKEFLFKDFNQVIDNFQKKKKLWSESLCQWILSDYKILFAGFWLYDSRCIVFG